ncbi:MAG: UDP-3-O-acyl-N-acetylglucosamine deacetylase, partial [Bacteroidota bacterium]
MERQYTLQAAVSFSGRGLHTGEHAQLEIFPAADNHGFQFQRTDLKDKPVIPAHLDGVTGTARGTSLSYQGVEIHTVEHILAALVSLGIDNALIGVSGPEIPILDGSAREFVQQLQAVGRQAQQAEKTFAQVQEGLEFHDPQKDATYRISPADSFSIDTHIDFGNKSLGRQSAHLASLQSFPEEIAPARTFCFFHEIEHLRAANLIKGGSLKSALVFLDEVPTLAH